MNTQNNEEKRISHEDKKMKLFAAMSGASAVGIIASWSSIFQNISTKASSDSILKITLSGGALFISTELLKIGLEGYIVSKRQKEELSEKQKIKRK